MICASCPRHCGVERPESGCGVKLLPGFCHSPLRPVLARAGLHKWEEPVISGTRGSGAVFFSGCNLHCVFCQNYGISTLNQGTEISVARLREIYGELAAQGAHNINLVTPSHYAATIAESLNPPPPLPVVWNSNGYDEVATLQQLAGKIQIYLPDLKYVDSELSKRYSMAEDYFAVASRAIDEMYRQTGNYIIDDQGIMQRGVVIRHLILPGLVANSLQVIDYVAHHFKPGQVLFSLMRQYVPYGLVLQGKYPELNRQVTDEEYNIVEQFLFDSGIEDGFVQEKESADEEFIPSFDGSGVLKELK